MSHWRTSGRSRLKAQQKRSFAQRAQQRANVVAPEAMMTFGYSSSRSSVSSHPQPRRRNQAKAKYSYGNPIGRRGVVVSIGSSQKHYYEPKSQEQVQPPMNPGYSRRIRDPNLRYTHDARSTVLPAHPTPGPFSTSGQDQARFISRQQLYRPEEITTRKPPFAGRKRFPVPDFQDTSLHPENDCVLDETLATTLLDRYSVGEPGDPYIVGDDIVTQQTLGSNQPEFPSRPVQWQAPGISRFMPRINHNSLASQHEVGGSEWQGDQKSVHQATHGLRIMSEINTAHNFPEHEHPKLRFQPRNVDPAACFEIGDPPWETGGPVHGSPKFMVPSHYLSSRSEDACSLDASTRNHIGEICVPTEGLHRRPSDVTDAFSYNEPSQNVIAQLSVLKKGPDEICMLSNEHTSAGNRPYLNPDKLSGPHQISAFSGPDKHGGIPRFQNQVNMNNFESIFGMNHINQDINATEKFQEEPSTALQPKQAAFDTPIHKRGLRFFNNGFEVDVTGRPLSRPGSPANSSNGSPVNKPCTNGSKKDVINGSLSPDTRFLERVGVRGKSIWDCY